MEMTRSQILLCMPVDNVTATLVLHDGARSNVMLFVPAGEDVSGVVAGGRPFVPVVRDGRVCLVARAAIASLAVASAAVAVPGAPEDELPSERQRAAIQLRSGVRIEGELRWVTETGRRRTTDYLNHEAPFFVVHDGDTTHYVAKAHVATVTEL